MEWMLVKTPFLQLTGTNGLGLARETSHMRFFLPKGKNLILNDVETAASCVSVHSNLATTIRERSTPPVEEEKAGSAVVMDATLTAATNSVEDPGSEEGEDSSLPPGLFYTGHG
jgi:hypothetical protein